MVLKEVSPEMTQLLNCTCPSLSSFLQTRVGWIFCVIFIWFGFDGIIKIARHIPLQHWLKKIWQIGLEER